ncbi:hypothetical protein IEO21_05796 [Rhodonia placenta]|uniref:Heme haloperoxidase family profile domain-containing protein n=1 Tax=Rhodonia placenta TaxID=104341 RepID=A0A8H7U1R8_9APHY|nr:hypothetical protein IEO21_05796 [Postia placenta]
MAKMSLHSTSLHRLLLKYALVTALMAVVVKMITAVHDLTLIDVPPFSLDTHPFVPPKLSDSRSPCPALNTLANHGMLRHDGREITRTDYIRALRQGYNLSLPLATFLTISGHVLLSQYSTLSLSDLGRHNFIEHNASLGHWDAVGDEEYAPDKTSSSLISQLVNQSTDGRTMSMRDLSAARILREKAYSRPLDSLHEEIARGEMSMVLGIFGRGNESVPISWIEEWWKNETFPRDFVPEHEQTLWKTVRGSWKINMLMRTMRAEAGISTWLLRHLVW